MGLNNAVPVSIVLEVIMVAAHSSSTLSVSEIDDRAVRTAVIFIDDFFMSVTSIFIIISIAWFIYLKNFDPTHRVRLVRLYQGIILILAGVAMAWASFQVKREGEETYRAFELRLVSSVLALGDGLLYFFNPKSKSLSSGGGGRRRRRGVDPSFPNGSSSDGNNQIYVIGNDLPGYEPPPSYFDIHPEAQRPAAVVIAPAAGTQPNTTPVLPQQTQPPPPPLI